MARWAPVIRATRPPLPGILVMPGSLYERDDCLFSLIRHQYLQAVKQFAKWMVQDGRGHDSPIAHLQGGNVNADRRHARRASGAVERRRLLETTRTGPTRFGMTGPQRALLYRLAVETVFGLRSPTQSVRHRAHN